MYVRCKEKIDPSKYCCQFPLALDRGRFVTSSSRNSSLNNIISIERMLLSRGAAIFKCTGNLNFNKPAIINIRQSSNGARWCYRSVPTTENKPWLIITEICGGIMWWWVLWNFWHDSARVVGHFPYPRPIEWSDEELGIPPDESDI